MQIKETLKKLGRSETDQMIGGVCAGIAETTDTPPWLWRAVFLAALLFLGTGVLVYVILWVVLPPRSKVV
jgi:phage shock protein PspC (stress-responsive transcriptional regulator)